MQVTLLHDALHAAIQDATRFIASKPQLPVLSGVHLQTHDGVLTMQSTDLKVGFQTTIGGKVMQDGACVVAVKPLSELLGTLPAGQVTLEVDGSMLHVSTTDVSAKLQTFPVTEFPPFPVIPEGGVRVAKDAFIGALDKVLYAASPDESRPILSSVQFSVEDELMTVVCTDGYRLSLTSIPVDSVGKLSVLVAAKTVQELCRTLARSKATEVVFQLSYELLQVTVTCGDMQLFARVTEGEFPPYKQIIPEQFALEATFEKDACASALKTALVFAKESSSIVSFVFGKSLCTIQSSAQGVGENEVRFPTSYTGENTTIFFNAKFVLDVLSRISSSTVQYKMNDPLKAVVFADPSNPAFTAIIMPFKR